MTSTTARAALAYAKSGKGAASSATAGSPLAGQVDPSRRFSDRYSWKRGATTPLFTNASQAPGYALASIYWFAPFPLYKYVSNPIAKYIAPYSTDHDSGQGGISLALCGDPAKDSDRPLGPWSQYQPPSGVGNPVLPGAVFVDRRVATGVSPQTGAAVTTINDAAGQTETPSIIWDSKIGGPRMFYQQINGAWTPPSGVETASYAGQCTLSCVSMDGGRTWTKDPNFIIDHLPGYLGVGGHTGYFNTFQVNDRWEAYHLVRDTNRSTFGLSHAIDGGSEWSRDYRELGLYMHVVPRPDGVRRFISWNHCQVVRMKDGLKLIGIASNFSSGSTPKDARIIMAPIADDLRTITGPVEIIWSPTLAWESGDLRSVNIMVDYGVIYVFYLCKTLAGAQNVGVLTYGV